MGTYSDDYDEALKGIKKAINELSSNGHEWMYDLEMDTHKDALLKNLENLEKQTKKEDIDNILNKITGINSQLGKISNTASLEKYKSSFDNLSEQINNSQSHNFEKPDTKALNSGDIPELSSNNSGPMIFSSGHNKGAFAKEWGFDNAEKMNESSKHSSDSDYDNSDDDTPKGPRI